MHWVPILWDLLYRLFVRSERRIPNHIAFIPNGNRRWATIMRRALEDSYLRAAKRALTVVEWSREAGVQHVTFFGLSGENREKRKKQELDALVVGALHFFRTALAHGYKVHAFGDIEALRGEEHFAELFTLLEQLQKIERGPDDFTIHVAVNYSGSIQHETDPLLDAVYRVGDREVRGRPQRSIRSSGVPAVDLVLRTGAWRESRLSGLLPFQTAYAEIYFAWFYWNGFRRRHFRRILRWYATRNRNHGR